MADTHFELTYGTTKCAFSIPSKMLSGPMIAPRENQPINGDPKEIIERALAAPVDHPRLRHMAQGRKVGIVISDSFRAGLQREILNGLLDEMVPGNPNTIVVISATGTHDPAVYAKNTGVWVEEARQRLGVAIDFEPHDSENSEFCDLGETSRGTKLRFNSKLMRCDLRVYGHESKHHYLNGYSSIDKQMVPGVSSTQTVAMNHKWALDPDSGPGRNPWHKDPLRAKNPFAEDGREARKIGEGFIEGLDGKPVKAKVLTFGLDMVSSGRNIYWVMAGSPEKICEKMVETVDDLMEYRVKRAKYVIVSPGGPPISQAIYGTQNCFDLAIKGAVQKGGEALVTAPLNGRPDLPADVSGIAPDARSKKLFFDNLVRLIDKPLEEARAEIFNNFQLYLWKTDRVLRLMNGDRVKIYIFSNLSEDKLAMAGFHCTTDIQTWIDERVARNDGLFTVINDGNKLCITGID